MVQSALARMIACKFADESSSLVVGPRTEFDIDAVRSVRNDELFTRGIDMSPFNDRAESLVVGKNVQPPEKDEARVSFVKFEKTPDLALERREGHAMLHLVESVEN